MTSLGQKVQVELRAKNKNESAIQILAEAWSRQGQPDSQSSEPDELDWLQKTGGTEGGESGKGAGKGWQTGVEAGESLCPGEGVPLRIRGIWARDGTEWKQACGILCR